MEQRIKHQQGHKPGQGKAIALIGAGYSARAMIGPLKSAGFTVFATATQQGSVAELCALGARGFVYRGGEMDEALKDALRGCDALLCSVPPGKGGDPVIGALKALSLPRLSWAGYLSATSVYGDRAGQWAFEDELLFPLTARGRGRVEAELAWMESGLPVHIFRLAGIYGPGRAPFDKIRSGEARSVIKPGHVVNRIHVTDIYRAVMASLARPDPLEIYNLADDHPAPPQDVLDYAAKLIGQKPPQRLAHETANISDMARSFYLETKRVATDKIKERLDWEPLYPSYKEGLVAILAQEKSEPLPP